MNKNTLHGIGINIINTCNFNCDGCCSLSNYNFSGYQRWDDYKDIYTQWSERINLASWELIGGEPTLNPTYLDWIKGLFELWPDSIGSLRTNGSTITPTNKKLYNFLLDLNKPISIDISYHNANRVVEVLDNIKEWLSEPLEITRYPNKLSDLPTFQNDWRSIYNDLRGADWPNCDTIEEWDLLPEKIRIECDNVFNVSPSKLEEKLLGYRFVDKNGIVVQTHHENLFNQTPLIAHDDLVHFSLYNSDPDVAHQNCGNRNCTMIVRGKIYKCNTVPHFAEFDKQYNLLLSENDRALLNAVPAGSVDMSDSELTRFIAELPNVIPQCKFCIEQPNVKEIFASTKKIKFVKKLKEKD